MKITYLRVNKESTKDRMTDREKDLMMFEKLAKQGGSTFIEIF